MQSSQGSGRVRGSEMVNGRGHVNGQHKGGRGRNRIIGTQLPNRNKSENILAFGLSLVGFGEERQHCREALLARRF